MVRRERDALFAQRQQAPVGRLVALLRQSEAARELVGRTDIATYAFVRKIIAYLKREEKGQAGGETLQEWIDSGKC